MVETTLTRNKKDRNNKGEFFSGTNDAASEKEFKKVSLGDIQKGDKWIVIFFWPKEFRFVCPTEIKGFNDKFGEFRDRDAALVGGSTDTAHVHLAWRNSHEDLKDLKFPIMKQRAEKDTYLRIWRSVSGSRRKK